MDAPLFSVIIPCYCAEKTVRAAAESVLRQARGDTEILLVDDASTDGTGALLEELAQQEGVRTVRLEKNAGAAEARNTGISLAEGEYLLFLDADDVYLPGLLDRLRGVLAEHHPEVILWGLTEEYYAGGQMVRAKTILPEAGICRTEEEVRSRALPLEEQGLYGYLWNKAYLRESLAGRGIRIPTQSFNEDEMMNLVFFQNVSSMVLLDEAYSCYRKQEGSLTHRFLPDYYPLAMKRIAGLLLQQRQWGQDTEEVRRRLASLWLRYLLSALERNGDPRAGMTAQKRRSFARKLPDSVLAKELLPHAAPDSRILRLLADALRHRRTGQMLALGSAVRLARRVRPSLFYGR